jgi:hypothetical protein
MPAVWWKSRSGAISPRRENSAVFFMSSFRNQRSSELTTSSAKKPVQKILYTRFANLFLEPVWNGTHIRSVQINMAENFGVQGRGRFCEQAGVIRDVIQNHRGLACLRAGSTSLHWDLAHAIAARHLRQRAESMERRRDLP